MDAMKDRLRKHRYILLLVICVAGILLSYALLHRKPVSEPVGKVVPSVHTVTVEKGPLAREIRFMGKTVPLARIDIVNQYPGTVETVAVDLGDTVEPGDFLLKQDSAYAEAELYKYKSWYASADASADKTSSEFSHELDRQRSALDLAQKNYDRFSQLYQEGAISKYEFDVVEQKLEDARAAYEELASQVQEDGSSSTVEEKEQTRERRRGDYLMREDKVKNMSFYAPRKGVITYRHAEEGSFVPAGTKLLTISDVSRLYVDAEVSEKDAAFLAVGQPVTVSIDALGQEISGTVLFASPDTGEGKTYLVRVVPDTAGYSLKAGLLCRISCSIPEKEDVISLPSDAVLEKNGRYYVFVLTGGKAVQKEVTPGLVEDKTMEISGGISAGDRVITDSLPLLKDGMVVKEGETS